MVSEVAPSKTLSIEELKLSIQSFVNTLHGKLALKKYSSFS